MSAARLPKSAWKVLAFREGSKGTQYAQFARLRGIKPCGMARALEVAGIALEGTHHRAIDDARNIAKMAVWVIPRLEAEGAVPGGA